MVIQEEDNIIMDSVMEFTSSYPIAGNYPFNMDEMMQSTLYNQFHFNIQYNILQEGEVIHDAICTEKGEYLYTDLLECIESFPYKYIIVSTRLYYMYIDNLLKNMLMDWTIFVDASSLLAHRGTYGDKEIYTMAKDFPGDIGLIINTDGLGYKSEGTIESESIDGEIKKTLTVQYGVRDTPKLNIKVFTDCKSSDYVNLKRRDTIESIIKD